MRLVLIFLLFVCHLGAKAQLFTVDEIISNQADGGVNIAFADTDSDGDDDIFFCSIEDNYIGKIENLGEDGFGTIEIIQFLDGVNDIQLFDLDQDGDDDIICSGYAECKIRMLQNDGAGNFSEDFILADVSGVQINFADFNEDGNIDIALFHKVSHELYLIRNEGNLEFTVANELSLIYTLSITDFDNDGDLDVISSTGSSYTRWHEYLGDFEFANPVTILNTGANTLNGHLVDLDLDGIMDFVGLGSIAYQDYYFAWAKGISNFEFEDLEFIWDDGEMIYQYEIFDANNDGDLEIALSFSFIDKILLLDQVPDSDGEFEILQTIERESPRISFIKDLDGDSDLEMILFHSNSTHEILNNNSGQGCTDPLACNYSETSYQEDGSCCFVCGCTSPNAANYYEDACFDDGSCTFELLVKTFADEDGDGIFDFDEAPLPFLPVLNTNDGLTYFTDSQGTLTLTFSESDPFTISVFQSEVFPFFTTPFSVSITLSELIPEETLNFGYSNTFSYYELESFVNTAFSGNMCDSITSDRIVLFNAGSSLLPEVNFEIIADELFQSVQEHPDYPTDSIIGNTVYGSIENLSPGEYRAFNYLVHSPTVDFIGDTLTSISFATGKQDNIELCTSSFTNNTIHSCAYDPNDKRVLPEGYTESHFVQQGEELFYRIRFQNTGNAPATDVLLKDTLDINLDLSTFELVDYSHDLAVTLNSETREIEFFFENIMLADSVNNEPESHGFINYRIEQNSDAPLLAEINNTAYIYFDNNPPIQTNVTWTTLYDCSLFEANLSNEETLLTASDGDSFQWYLNGEPIQLANDQTYVATESGEYAVEVNNDFPCSRLSNSLFISVVDVEENQKMDITVFPNPAESLVTIDFGTSTQPKNITLFNSLGKNIFNTRINAYLQQHHLNCSSFSPGLYYLNIESEGVTTGIKLMIK